VLLDNGLNLNRAAGPPCFSRQDSQVKGDTSNEISVNPIIIPRPPGVHIGVTHPKLPDPDEEHARHPHSICHVASLLPFYFGIGFSNNNLMPRPEMLFLLSDVFRLVTSAECQFLNRLYALVRDQQRHLEHQRELELALDNLVYIKTLLDEHKQRLEQTIAFFTSRGVSSPAVRPANGASQTSSQEGLASTYLDFKELLHRTESLGKFCVENMNLIMNSAMLMESQKTVERADDQRRLTVAAYLFLPLSLVSSLFGMNVKELGTGTQHIWLPGVILLPIGLMSLILFYPQYFKRAFKLLGRPKQNQEPAPSAYQTQGATRAFSTSSPNTAAYV